MEDTEARIQRTAIASIAVAVMVMAIKYLAYWVTGSVALYSDALESTVNIVTAVAAMLAIRVSSAPADRQHPFGHHKAEYFSAVFEGVLIVVAALLVLEAAWGAIREPREITAPALGLAINLAAAAINAGWAWWLISRGGIWRSPALAADGWHLIGDVVTSVGVIAGLALAAVTGWLILDPLLAAAVAINILWSGFTIMRQSMSSLLDEAASPEIQAKIRTAILVAGGGALEAHDIRTRHAGRATFVEFHLVVPGAMTVEAAHEICDRIEAAIATSVPGSDAIIHVEPDHKAKRHKTADAMALGPDDATTKKAGTS